MNDRRGVVARVAALERGVGDDRGAKLVAGIKIGRPHPGIDHCLKVRCRLPAQVHADPGKDHDDAGILANRPVAERAEARIGQDLRDGIARSGALLQVVGPAHRADEIRAVVIGNVLQGVGDAVDQVLFANDRHGAPNNHIHRRRF